MVDGDNPPFVGYHLDDSTPVGGQEKQCGGDLKAYGASGFGIDGISPNTDPILAPIFLNTRDLSVNRVRYFGAPDATVAEAEQLRARTENPLTARREQGRPSRQRRPGIQVKVLNRKAEARSRQAGSGRGRAGGQSAVPTSTGTATATGVRIVCS